MISARSQLKLWEIGNRKTVKLSPSPRPSTDSAKHTASTLSAMCTGFMAGFMSGVMGVIGRARGTNRDSYVYEPQFAGQEQLQFANTPMQSRAARSEMLHPELVQQRQEFAARAPPVTLGFAARQHRIAALDGGDKRLMLLERFGRFGAQAERHHPCAV